MKLKDYSLKIKLGFIFAMFFLLYTLSFLVQNHYINNQKNIGKLINVAGQQRMILQKIVNDTLLVNNRDVLHKEELMKSAMQYEHNLQWLLRENHAPLAAQHITKLIPIWKSYHSSILATIRAKEPVALQKASSEVLKRSHSILKETNHLVTLLESYAQHSTDRLQWISLFILLSNFTVAILAIWISSKEIIHPIIEVFLNINRVATGQLHLESMPVDRKDEIGQLKASFNRMLYSLKQIEQTGIMQKSFLPENLSNEKFKVSSIYQASEYVSGDLFNYIWNPQHNILKGYLFDIMGHGFITSIQASSLRVLFEQALYLEGTPSEKMTWVNREAVKYFTEDTFAAAFYFEFNWNHKTLVLSTGGINQFLALRNGQVTMKKVEGCFIGLSNQMEFEDFTEDFCPGDSFIFMSDGVNDHLPPWITHEERSDISTIYQEILRMTPTYKNHDDMSAIFFEIK